MRAIKLVDFELLPLVICCSYLPTVSHLKIERNLCFNAHNFTVFNRGVCSTQVQVLLGGERSVSVK